MLDKWTRRADPEMTVWDSPKACPRCTGPRFPDTLELADTVCIWCGSRYLSDMTLIRRPPTEEEMSKRKRYIYTRVDR